MTEKKDEGLLSVKQVEYQDVGLSETMAWLKNRIGKIVQGGIYLIAGQPGIGKSTLGIQTALDLGKQGIKTLYILTEQSKGDLVNRAKLMTSGWPSANIKRAFENVKPEDTIYDIETLPAFISHQVLSPSGAYKDVKYIVLDSVQGHGLSATATKKYKQIYEFCRQAKSAGITVLLVAHITKRGEIAGPKDLEHNVDCVIVMRKAMIYRPMFVPKNRFGMAILKPIPLEMDKKTTELKIAKHSESTSTVAKTFVGQGIPLAEIQAAVSLPVYGSKGKITAPGLPRKEIEQLTNCIAQIPDLDIGDLDFTIHCRMPGEHQYRSLLGLPLAIALIASYLQKDIPVRNIYLGEIDLLRQVREIPANLVSQLIDACAKNEIPKPFRLYLPREVAGLFQTEASGMTVVACDRLEDAVFNTWPELKP